MNGDFDVRDSSTWPVLLTPAHIAAIWQRSVAWVNRKCALGEFVPAPKDDTLPRRWRKVDVERHLGIGQHRRSA